MNINEIVNYIIVVFLIVLSLFVNRPFCRAICPIGFVLGWVARIPYARRLHIKDFCIGCSKCKTRCDKGAIVGEKSIKHRVDANACIFCGECMSECPQQGFTTHEVKQKKTNNNEIKNA